MFLNLIYRLKAFHLTIPGCRWFCLLHKKCSFPHIHPWGGCKRDFMKDVIIIGGGLAGLVNAIQLASAGLETLVIEKKTYPFHRVCGEYISNEVLPFLQSIGADPSCLEPSRISKLQVSSASGNMLELPLEMGGFGVSRFALDNFLYSVALSKGVEFRMNTAATDIKSDEGRFYVLHSGSEVEEAPLVIGSFGKRSNMDRQLGRKFFQRRSPYIAVKYHIRADFPEDTIALHNFKDGYCGISKVEGDRYCLCYLSGRENLRSCGTIDDLQHKVLFRNPYLEALFQDSEFLYEEPLVINEISFEPKSIVEDHILMAGDAAGMIAPLCGNGMAMAIHSAKILSALIIRHYRRQGFDRSMLESSYEYEWKKMFAARLFIGRSVQRLFGGEYLTDLTVRMLKKAPPLGKWIVRQTHGQIF